MARRRQNRRCEADAVEVACPPAALRPKAYHDELAGTGARLGSTGIEISV